MDKKALGEIFPMPRKLKVTELEELGYLPEVMEMHLRGDSYDAISRWLHYKKRYDIGASTVRKVLKIAENPAPRKGHSNNGGRRKLPISDFRKPIEKFVRDDLNIGQIRKRLRLIGYNAGSELGRYITSLGITTSTTGPVGTSPVDYYNTHESNSL
jgi:hypothetical protein